MLWHQCFTNNIWYCDIMNLLVLCHHDDLTNFWSCDIMIVHPTSYIALRHRVQATSDPVISHSYDYLLLLYHHGHLPLLLWHRNNTINFWTCNIMTVRPTSYISLRHHDSISIIWSCSITSAWPVTVIVPTWPFVQLLLFTTNFWSYDIMTILVLVHRDHLTKIWFVTRFDFVTSWQCSKLLIMVLWQTSPIGMRYKNVRQTVDSYHQIPCLDTIE